MFVGKHSYASGIILYSLIRSNFPLSLRNLQVVHARSIIVGLKSFILSAKLIENYCATPCGGNTHDANKVFHQCGRSSLFLLNTLIRCVPPADSVSIFAYFHSKGDFAFDDHTHVFAFGACARLATPSALCVGMQVHALAFKSGLMDDTIVKTTSVHFYASNADITSARKMFNETYLRNNITYGAMIAGYNSQANPRNRHAQEALILFRDMLRRDSVSNPTPNTVTCVLSTTAQLGVLRNGSCLHGFIKKKIPCSDDDVYIGTALVDMYSKCGCVASALNVFGNMKERNVHTWTAIVTGLAFHGKGREAIRLLNSMRIQRVEPNSVTFTSLLSACCHAGLLEEGLHLFEMMKNGFGILPVMQHYGCIVDLLGRAGRLKEAYQFACRMPIEPDAVLWRALLRACMFHGNVVLAERVSKNHLLHRCNHSSCGSLDCDDFIALSNVYADAGKWDHVNELRKAMKKANDSRAIRPGHSSVL